MNLLERIANNDQTAVAECVERYGALIWSLTKRWITDSMEAEDAVQEVFLALWRAAAQFDSSKSAESTFVSMIARRRLIDRLRTKKTEIQYSGQIEDFDMPAEQTTPEDNTEVSIVRQVLSRFLSPQKEILILSVVAGVSHGNIAKQLDLPLGTVKTYINRGLKRIRQELGLTQDGSNR